jgi:hypothetical protein
MSGAGDYICHPGRARRATGCRTARGGYDSQDCGRSACFSTTDRPWASLVLAATALGVAVCFLNRPTYLLLVVLFELDHFGGWFDLAFIVICAWGILLGGIGALIGRIALRRQPRADA